MKIQALEKIYFILRMSEGVYSEKELDSVIEASIESGTILESTEDLWIKLGSTCSFFLEKETIEKYFKQISD